MMVLGALFFISLSFLHQKVFRNLLENERVFLQRKNPA